MGLRETEFVCVDVETTGQDAEKDRIVEVAAWRCLGTGERLAQPFVTKVNPGRSIPPETSAVHHITDDDVRDAPPPAVVMERLLDYMDVLPWVAHNVQFDARFLAAEVSRQGLSRKRTPAICTLRLARHLLPEAPSYGLQTLKYYLKLSRTPPHQALGDVQLACELLGHLVERYIARGEEDSVEALREFASHYVRVETMPRGRYRGRSLAALPTDYLEWVAGEGAFQEDQDLRHSLLEELKVRRRGETHQRENA
ncbi:MAG: DUF3820 family protein [Planctomycetota bacterium]